MADESNTTTDYQSSPTNAWVHNPPIYPHSHHGTPAQEYTGFNFALPPMPMDQSAFRDFSGSPQQRPTYAHLPNLVVPQWPSQMLHSQANQHQYQQMTHQSVQLEPIQQMHPMGMGTLPTPVSATPLSATPTSAKQSKAGLQGPPRKTLTDQDRKRMCQYAEENPNSKQTEIGAIFGVERSTVSKVLRHKDKYMFTEKISSSTGRVKRVPDIDRALANWAKNQERKGVTLTDDSIRNQAHAFATTASPEAQQSLNASWLEKFKQKNRLTTIGSRKGSLAPEDADSASNVASTSQTPNGTSPINSPSPKDLHNAKSQESLNNGSPDSTADYRGRRGPLHTQSTSSLNSAFTDTAPSSFSPGPLSPTSPFFTPDSATAPSPFVPPLTARSMLPITSGPLDPHRPRSQTFPFLNPYGNSPADSLTPKYTSTILDSPMEEAPDPMLSMGEAMNGSRPDERASTVDPSDTMLPPPLPAHITPNHELASAKSTGSLRSNTSPEEAHRAMETVWNYFKEQATESLNQEESYFLGRIMDKLELHSKSAM